MSAGVAIEARNVTVDHHTTAGVVRALDNLDLDVEAGESLAIMGPSGCGKSTLLGLLAGLAVPDSGTVTIGSDTVTELSERDRVRFRRRNLGMVYQADNLLPHLTVEENVALQLSITGVKPGTGGWSSPTDVLSRLEIDDLATRLPDKLSGGQRQRAAVARAVVHRPAIMLADEPTGSLDTSSAKAVIELFLDVQREMGATLVMVTHDPAMAAHADRSMRLERPNGHTE
ncbi:MAG: ABC transporter ATP-binding protein [Acidimicrobiia bacterium]|nr:ABC transporter ATP-binding protein [Acidimicrobiia bacterium]